MSEPAKQVEIQLGHMCNNRCSFCVSGQRTAMGEARPLEAAPILARIDEAYAGGHRKLTLLGGEPTLQPAFMDVVRHAVGLGFEEIVTFTNGVKTSHRSLIEGVLATGGNFTWRISIQGANEEAHESTTGKRGSWRRIVKTLEHLHALGERITVNMCMVRSNLDSVREFADLLLPFGAVQLHLDTMRPMDAGIRSEEELAAITPRLSDYAEPLEAMARAFDAQAPDFDLNVGNVPYCVAPALLHRIHHDGEHTDTIAIDDDDRLSKPWNKYLVKRRDKVHSVPCEGCLMRDRCSGVFESYVARWGSDELTPIDLPRLRQLDPEEKLWVVHRRNTLRQLRKLSTPELHIRTAERGEREAEIRVHDDASQLRLRFAQEGDWRYDGFALSLLSAEGDETASLGVRFGALLATLATPIAPIGADAGITAASVERRVARLRKQAPFGELRWTAVETVEDGVALRLKDPKGRGARVWLTERSGKALGGYELEGEASDALRTGLRTLLESFGRTNAKRPT